MVRELKSRLQSFPDQHPCKVLEGDQAARLGRARDIFPDQQLKTRISDR